MRLELQLGIFQIRLELASFAAIHRISQLELRIFCCPSLRVNVTNHMKKVLQQT